MQYIHESKFIISFFFFKKLHVVEQSQETKGKVPVQSALKEYNSPLVGFAIFLRAQTRLGMLVPFNWFRSSNTIQLNEIRSSYSTIF